MFRSKHVSDDTIVSKDATNEFDSDISDVSIAEDKDETPLCVNLLSRAFNSTFQKLEESTAYYSRVIISDGETEQTYLIVVDAEAKEEETPIKVYPIIPNAKELFGYGEKADKWRCCVFGIANDVDHLGEVTISTPRVKRIAKQLRETGDILDSDVDEFVQEVADWTLRTSILRKAIVERKKNETKKEKRQYGYSSDECPKCKRVVFSQRAYISILAEALSRDPLETGGVFFGQYDDDGTWYVVEATDPGLNTYHSTVHNEMDDKYYNHLYPVLSRLYKHDLRLVGLWHRHPGSMDHFSRDDNNTNSRFAEAIGYGTLSVLINFDPKERLTCYYLDQEGTGEYYKLPVYIGDKHFKHTEYLELASSSTLWKEKPRLQEEIQN